MARVRFENVDKIYSGKVVAATDINLEIMDKELLVLVGPSGCGKSTVLRMVAGLEEATAGRIYFDDEDVTDLSPKDRNIAMVFQNYALYPHMTVYENMAFGLKLRKHPREEIEERVGEAAGLLGIEKLLERKPKALSGGQRQRVALGRAIVRKPRVFLFDEPLSNLDAKMRVQMRAEIRKLNLKIKTTMIYVTHDQVEAMTLGDRLAVMNEGRILQVGSPIDLYNRPADRFVAAFIGSPAMNFMEGTLRPGAEAVLETSFSRIPLPDKFGSSLGGSTEGRFTIGIRPEDVRISKDGSAPDGFHGVPAVIELYETLGNEMIFHLRCGDELLISREAPDVTGSPGTKVQALLDMSKVHLFDGVSGKSLGIVPG